MKLLHTPKPCIFKIRFNIILQLMHLSSKWYTPLKFETKTVSIYSGSHSYYMPRQPRSTRFDRINMRWRADIMKLFIM
jgi:hypothetical protein